MGFNLEFAAELATERFSNLEECIEALPVYRYRSVSPGDLSFRMERDSRAILGARGREYWITEWCFGSLLRYLGLSRGSASALSHDVLEYVVNEQLKQKPLNASVVLCARDGIIVNLGPNPPYWPISSEDLVSGLGKAWEIPSITISERGIYVDVIDEVFPTIELQVGDIVKGGLFVRNSESFGEPLAAEILVYRVVCANGAILGKRLGHIRADRELSHKYFNDLSRFFEDLRGLSSEYLAAKRLLLSLPSENATDEYLMQLWTKVRTIIGKADRADDVLKLRRSERLGLAKRVRERHGQNLFLRSLAPDLKPEPTEISISEIFNRITEGAQHRPYSESIALQRLGGRMLFDNCRL